MHTKPLKVLNHPTRSPHMGGVCKHQSQAIHGHENMFFFKFFHSEITPVHWALIITALSGNRLTKTDKSSTGSQQFETNATRHVYYVAVVITSWELYIITRLDMLTSPHAAAASDAIVMCKPYVCTFLIHKTIK